MGSGEVPTSPRESFTEKFSVVFHFVSPVQSITISLSVIFLSWVVSMKYL